MCIVFSAALPAFAEYTEPPADETTVSEEDVTPADEDDEEDTDPDREVVSMYLCATANSLTGHVWLYFENLTDSDLPLGYAVLKANSFMSVGSLRNTRKNHGGTYYNGEAFMAKNPEKLKEHTTSIKMNLTEEQLKTVSEEIKSHNLYILVGWNCGNFACKVWNSVSDEHVVHIVFPVFTILSMLIHGGEKGTVLMKHPDISEVFKQTKDGIIQADAKSFRISCIG